VEKLVLWASESEFTARAAANAGKVGGGGGDPEAWQVPGSG
jgi:hypothetical protein